MAKQDDDYVIVSRGTLERLGVHHPENLSSLEIHIENGSRHQAETLLTLFIGGLIGFWIGSDCDL